MNSKIWLVNKILGSSNVTSYTTVCYPLFAPTTALAPFIIYEHIGFEKNRILRNDIFSITSVHNSISSVELLNDSLYNLFDNSTSYIKETSSNLRIESVEIVKNVPVLYDETNQYYTRPLDISVWYSNY